jgi:amino acid permease
MGPWTKALIDFCITTSQIGFCIAYILYVGDQVEYVICYESNHQFCDMKSMYILISALILIPICWLKSLKYISYVSALASVAIMFSCKHIFNPINSI